MFNIDIDSILPSIIDALTYVYGEEYREIISSRVNNSIIFQYFDLEGFEDYIDYIKRCKRRELSYEFLSKIGFTFDFPISLSSPLDDNIKFILDCIIGNEYAIFDKNLSHYFSPILSFEKRNPIDRKKIMENRLKIINFLRNSDSPVTFENYDKFMKTRESKKILKKISYFKSIYNILSIKYNEFEKKFIPYIEFIESEKNRFEEIMYSKKISFFNEIFPLLNNEIIIKIKNMPITAQEDIIIGNRELSEKTPLEYFSSDDMTLLKDENTSLEEKFWIIFFQSNFLKNIGIEVDEDIVLCDNDECIFKYLDFISNPEISKYIPSSELITSIKIEREKKYREAINSYYTQRLDFIDNIKYFVDNDFNRQFLLNQILQNEICVLSCGGKNINTDFLSLMFYTIKKNQGGKLLLCLIHEFDHIINQTENGCAFESRNQLYDFHDKNQFNKDFRKYERFNEILSDIFALEAVNYLHSNNNYLIEDKKYISDNNNFNTSSCLKTILYPLINKYRYYICKSKINSDPSYLIDAIGLQNFESLVYSINKIDNMIKNGLFKNDEHLSEYYSELEKIEKIYYDIDIFHHSIKHILKK